jgi:hypothetical protein
MQALLIFLFFFCAALFFLNLPFFNIFIFSKVPQEQDTIEDNHKILVCITQIFRFKFNRLSNLLNSLKCQNT